MNATEQLAEIRERIAQMSQVDAGSVEFAAIWIRHYVKACGRNGRLALALVSAEMAMETKS